MSKKDKKDEVFVNNGFQMRDCLSDEVVDSLYNSVKRKKKRNPKKK